MWAYRPASIWTASWPAHRVVVIDNLDPGSFRWFKTEASGR